MLPELLLLVADHLSVGDFINFRLTCHWVKDVLTPPFHKLCLQDVDELTVIQWAAIRGHAKLIKLAILNGAEKDLPFLGDLTMRPIDGRIQRYKCYFRHPNMLTNTGIFYNGNNSEYRTPLFFAAGCGNVKAIEVLLDLGARTQFNGLMTPAHAAATQWDVLCMQAFVRPGFDINVRGHNEYTFLHYAIVGGEGMLKYILQLDGGKNLVNARTRSGLTPLHCICKTGSNIDCKKSQIELLLQYGADIYARDKDGYTPAHTFAYWGQHECLQVLIDAGFDMHTTGKCGKTILHCTARWNRKKTLEYLLGLKKGRDIIDMEDNHQLTALDYAYRASDWSLVELLLFHDAQRKSFNAIPLVPITDCCDRSYPIGGSVLEKAW